MAERLPYPDEAFDLVVSTTSFDHWADQQAGLTECARVLEPGGRLVLADQFSAWLPPTLAGRAPRQGAHDAAGQPAAAAAGFRSVAWHARYAVIIRAVTARK